MATIGVPMRPKALLVFRVLVWVTALDCFLAGTFVVAVESTALIRVTVALVLLVFLADDVCFFVAKVVSPKLNSLLLQTVNTYSSVLCHVRQACYHRNNVIILIVTLLLAGLVAVLWAIKMFIVVRRYHVNFVPKKLVDIPSVSVCIPARNEIHALTECLERVLASDYPKLEILVLDDNSADDTSLIIRSFAHAGVRFIAGSPLPAGWLGKNFALSTLLSEASGTYVLYMDVDTKLSTTSISRIANLAVNEKAAMVSVIPDRYDTDRPIIYFGTLRYFWELLLSTRKSPPASSSAWFIDRQMFIDELGGFDALRASVRPEVAIARVVSEKSAYQGVVHSGALGIGYEKRWASQVETSRRILYQMAGGTWFKGVFAVLGLIILNLPTLVVMSSVMTSWGYMHSIALIVLVLFIATYGLFLSRTWRTRWWLGMVLWPYIIFQELVLFVTSMTGYVSHTITWKGRSIERTHLDAPAISLGEVKN